MSRRVVPTFRSPPWILRAPPTASPLAFAWPEPLLLADVPLVALSRPLLLWCGLVRRPRQRAANQQVDSSARLCDSSGPVPESPSTEDVRAWGQYAVRIELLLRGR